MKVLRVFLTVALFSGGIAMAGDGGDKGLGVDPNGRGLHAAAADQGVFIDPNGVRHAAAADDGRGIDPNGGIRH
ncbi:MAG: hypothetical protein JO093_21855 [Acidobacteria bacterium]|nr:hypothetical protein [Acidobacteriota bacterium]MBV9188269.1 hypothetical protein [Acidobacteriota bacterium]